MVMASREGERERKPKPGNLGDIVREVMRKLQPPPGTAPAQPPRPVEATKIPDLPRRKYNAEEWAKAVVFGPCPSCKAGMIHRLEDEKTGKRFAGCSNYPACKNGYPLPHRASEWDARPLPDWKPCERCWNPAAAFHHARPPAGKKARRPFWGCLNPRCETRAWKSRPRLRG
jgi:ssDNA-binding Zn-finger/Zn-ribbon topoisomerase 1